MRSRAFVFNDRVDEYNNIRHKMLFDNEPIKLSEPINLPNAHCGRHQGRSAEQQRSKKKRSEQAVMNVNAGSVCAVRPLSLALQGQPSLSSPSQSRYTIMSPLRRCVNTQSHIDYSFVIFLLLSLLFLSLSLSVSIFVRMRGGGTTGIDGIRSVTNEQMITENRLDKRTASAFWGRNFK